MDPKSKSEKLITEQHLLTLLRVQTHSKGNSEERRLPLEPQNHLVIKFSEKYRNKEENARIRSLEAQEGKNKETDVQRMTYKGLMAQEEHARAQKGRVFRGPFIYLNYVWLSLGACLQRPYHNAHTVPVLGSLGQDRSAASRNPMPDLKWSGGIGLSLDVRGTVLRMVDLKKSHSLTAHTALNPRHLMKKEMLRKL